MAVQTTRVEELLEQRDWLRGLAQGLVHGDEAEDVAQEAMLSALGSPPPSDRPLRPWLARVATNVVRMSYRSNARRRRREQAFSEDSEQGSRDDLLQRFELHQMVAELMADLPEPFRSTLLCRYFDDRSSTEIAAAEGVAAGTVRWRIKRGLEMLRERLDEQSEDRKTWMLALQPLIEVPSKAAIAGGGSAMAVAKGVIAMKVGKMVAAVVAVAALSYGGYVVARSEPEARPAATTSTPTTQKPESAGPEPAAPKPEPMTAPKQWERRRKRLLSAIATARTKRTARTAAASGSPLPPSQSSDSLALPVAELDKDYIRDQMKEILPLVRGCYERTLLRRPDLEGKAVVEFSIVGEEEVGGLVELSEYDHEESTIEDEQLSECIQETMYALEFEPPEGGGRVVVRYPFEFHAASPEN